MNTLPLRSRVLETRYAWGPTIQEAMAMALDMEAKGWIIEGHPAPMILRGDYGTGVAIVRICDERD